MFKKRSLALWVRSAIASAIAIVGILSLFSMPFLPPGKEVSAVVFMVMCVVAAMTVKFGWHSTLRIISGIGGGIIIYAGFHEFNQSGNIWHFAVAAGGCILVGIAWRGVK